jgi:hypothetical protein
MPGRIVPKLSQVKPLEPLLWESMNKATQKRLQALIHTLSLAIYLWVIG